MYLQNSYLCDQLEASVVRDHFKGVFLPVNYDAGSKIRELRRYTTVGKKFFESSTDCDFESDCIWTWRKDIANGFFRTSGKDFVGNQTGPKRDADGKEYGE